MLSRGHIQPKVDCSGVSALEIPLDKVITNTAECVNLPLMYFGKDLPVFIPCHRFLRSTEESPSH
ncbi:hypothetical protein BJX68DRAFT_227650 [Aspergillus pseudodeflectus]|uniref:Uncharacterized protein n=1 Tax=Aspergillus pseudodeflectus TaxID=176178 RepID=A0ABR4L6B6_9EURO